jgi:pilus assembly protein CpaE
VAEKGKHSVVIVGAEEESDAIRAQIEGLAEVVALEPDPQKGVFAVRETEPDVVLLFLDRDPETILAVARQINQTSDCATIVVSRNREPDNILQAMRSGVRDFAFLDAQSEDVRRAVADMEKVQKEEAAADRGKIIAVFSAKGGSGATTIASNLAGALLSYGLGKNDSKRKVVLLDFDLEMGDVLVFLDIESRYSYVELLSNMHRLDAELLYRSLALHGSGLSVLSQTDQLEQAREVTAQEMVRVLDFLRRNFDFIVIDGLRDFRETALIGLDSADTVILTMTQDIPALKNADRCLRIFKRLGYPETKVRLVLNRMRSSSQLDPDAISDALGRRVHGTVVNDFPTVIKAINQGQLLVDAYPGARVAKDLRELVPLFFEAAPVRKRGFFSLWGRE